MNEKLIKEYKKETKHIKNRIENLEFHKYRLKELISEINSEIHEYKNSIGKLKSLIKKEKNNHETKND